MELSAWRDAVSYGTYLQPIHLEVVESTSLHSSISAAQDSSSESPQNLHTFSGKPTESSSNGTSAAQQDPEATTALQTAQSTAQLTDTTSVIAIPPFTCEGINGGEQMALNVGGPVWAMDWLPSKPAPNAAAVAAAIAKSNEKKPRRASAASKKAQKAALNGKENNQVEDADGDTTAASNGNPESQKDSKSEWRFLALATHPPCQVAEGKVVKNTPPDHYYDIPESARNMLQIWAIPVQRPKLSTDKRGKTATKSLVKPRLVYAIDHESGVAWDLQWCPLVKKFPTTNRRENILGILAACFGDGSMRVFKIPAIPEERLQVNIGKEQCLVEKNIPIVVAKLSRIMQLSVHWSPHTWNLLLTGGSDGSVSLWNIMSAVSGSDSLTGERNEPEPIEPQRRFQDADTIGKQEAFDWGCGWVAIRAVAWSPFDEHLFATTGNDSVFKVWDVREPRVCLRSHRIRSTWGLALQWMDQTSIQISGDQGSVYMYDILSGSYQKLHFHPQIDSPVWDLQFARRGAVPLLISSCTSGSIRAAPAKKMYRAPQNCVEICRLSGEKDASIDKPFKSLRVSFDKHSVLGSADTVSQSTREFCERDAALHRLRLSSITPGDYPCFLAAGGHAGLVILLEMQEMLDTLIPTFFMPPSKKTGRPKKIFATVGGHHVPKKKPTPATKGAAASAGRKARTLGSFAKAKGMHTALSKYKKKTLGNGKKKANPRANAKKKSFIQEDEEVDNSAEDEEPEFEEEDEEEDESDLSLVMGDSSDDDRVSVSDNAVEEEEATATESPEEARLMKEYQLDLSEEDAIKLAIQMSKEAVEEKPPAPATSESQTSTTHLEDTKAGAGAKKRTATAKAPRGGRRRRNMSEEEAVQLAIQMSIELVEEKPPAPVVPGSLDDMNSTENSGTKGGAAAKKQKKTATARRGGRKSSNSQGDTGAVDAVADHMPKELMEDILPAPTNAVDPATPVDKRPAKRSRITRTKSEPPAKKRKTTIPSRGKPRSGNDQGDAKSDEAVAVQASNKMVGGKESSAVPKLSKGPGAGAEAEEADTKTPASTGGEQQSGNGNEVSEETVKESSELIKEKPATSVVHSTAGPRASESATSSSNAAIKAGAASKKRKKTPTARGGRRSSVVSEAIQITKELLEEEQPAPFSANATAIVTPERELPAKRSNTGTKAKAAVKKRKKTVATPRGGRQSTSGQDDSEKVSKDEEQKQASERGAISESKEAASRFISDKAMAAATKQRAKTTAAPRGRRRSNNAQGDIMTEEDALRLALTISELEY
ncbi:hypothetical protein PInf_014729 [Phytophthora infestans]|nr:hypothetical protein PInf_014729 [Phytophthora infestans]